jgi:hypothetical protein
MTHVQKKKTLLKLNEFIIQFYNEVKGDMMRYLD